MKKFLTLSILIISSFVLSGSGYKGTLPDLNIKNEIPANLKQEAAPEILPLDKLTIPIKNKIIDKERAEYTNEMVEVIRQIERIKEVLDTDKSFKNFVAGANVLDLTTETILKKFPQKKFKEPNQKLSDINSDTQQIKNYWIAINKNAPYVSYYTTKGAYSGAILNEQLNNFAKVLAYAIKDLKTYFAEEYK